MSIQVDLGCNVITSIPFITETKTDDFTLNNDGGKRFLIDSPVDVTVTVNNGAGSYLKGIILVQMGLGQIIISAGTASVNIPSSKSSKSKEQFSTVTLQETSLKMFPLNIYRINKK